jgi:hypothetical protein
MLLPKEAIARLTAYYTRPWEVGATIRSFESYSNRIEFQLPTLEDVLECERLGTGNFSTVYGLSNRLVLKVANRNEDPAYEEYAKYCTLHAHANPYLPKIYYRGRIEKDHVFIRYYIMERLEPTSKPSASDYGDEEQIVPVPNWLFNLGFLHNVIADGAVKIADPHVHQLVHDIGHMLTDIAGRNIMKRPCGQFVLTDPCS